jgi:hypothetical protein
MFNIYEDRLDKSRTREVEEYENYQPYFSKFGRWHR